MDSIKSDIQEFYNDRSVLVTGATGFLGKVLVEKLLRSCPGLNKIYVLIREKRSKDPKERMREMVDCPVFERIKRTDPTLLMKIVPIVGDTSRPELGISPSDLQKISQDVSIIFHSAATVRFNEPMKNAIDLNVIATRRLLALCQTMPNIQAVIYVSTAFSNLTRKIIEEKVYPPPVHPQKVIDITEWMSPEMLETITPKLIGGLPNTYTFSKALAETLVVEECGKVPVTIVRPSIITSAWKEPIPGWIGSFSGPAGIIVAIGKGGLRSMTVHGEKVGDFIPVDVTSNLLIATAWYTATVKPNAVTVFNNTSYGLNKETWGHMENSTVPVIKKTIASKNLIPATFVSRRNRNYRTFYERIQSNTFIEVIDQIATVFSSSNVKKMKKKCNDFARQYEYITTDEWVFTCENVLMLNNMMSEEDKKTFYVDLKDMDWTSYWKDHVIGCHKYLLKEHDDKKSNDKEQQSLKKIYFVAPPVFVLLTVGAWKFSGSDIFTEVKSSLSTTLLTLPWK